MSHTRLEWLLVDYAILAAGAVTVPAYETSSAEQLQWILSDSESVAVVLETAEMAAMYSSIAEDTLSSAASFVIDDGGLDELALLGDSVDDAVLDERIAALTTDRLATIVYTSGTTGRPKGCGITHGNLRTNVVQNLDAVRSMLEPDEVSLVFLPLAHVMTKTIALVGTEWGIKLAFATDIAHLQEELAMVQTHDGGRRAAGVREGLQRRATQGPRRRARPHLRQVGRCRHPLVQEPHRRAEPTRSPGSPMLRSAGWCTASCKRSSAAGCASRSAAAARWANASPTSSTASGSGSSRATA